jgi:endonuclease/exonuclease/phosphatase family metal-dependent hydrolase
MSAEGEQRRYLMTTHPLPDGETLRVINTHLAAAWLDASYRLPQFSVLLDLWDEQPRTVIAGDLNTPPGSTDVGLMLTAGMTSAQDTIGDPDAGTVSADYPRIRYDWILASPDISFSDFIIPSTLASDHLPVAVTITVP